MKALRKILSWFKGDLIIDRHEEKNRRFAERYGRAGQPGNTGDLINATLVSMSAEETANWLRDPAGTSWLDHTVNPTLRARVTHMNARVRIAFFESALVFAGALDGNSDQTADRLRELKVLAEEGDDEATYQLAVLIGQLINTAFSGGDRQ